jgi:hypothetical protein
MAGIGFDDDVDESQMEEPLEHEMEYIDEDEVTDSVNEFNPFTDDTQEDIVNVDTALKEDIVAPVGMQQQNTQIYDSWFYRSRLAPNETEREYQYLETYLGLGTGRSINYLSQLLNLQQSTIYNIYKRNAWKARCADYDRNMLAKRIKLSQDARQEEHIQKLEQYRQEQELLGKQLTINAGRILQLSNRTLNRLLECDSGLPFKDMVGMLNAAAKMADVGKQLQSSALGVDQLMIALEEADIE